jgi:hypothetical protein
MHGQNHIKFAQVLVNLHEKTRFYKVLKKNETQIIHLAVLSAPTRPTKISECGPGFGDVAHYLLHQQ